MQFLFSVISLAIFISILYTPFLLFRVIYFSQKIESKFTTYFILAIIITFTLCMTWGWWESDFTYYYFLNHYGYDFNTECEEDAFNNVLQENKQFVKDLINSEMGIGWPLRVVLSYAFFPPFLLLFYIIKAVRVERKKDKVSAIAGVPPTNTSQS